MRPLKTSRRKLLTGLATLIGIGAVATKPAWAAVTPRASAGPFYPTAAMRTPDTDNDLVKIMGRVEQAGGEVFILRGTLKGENGMPLSGHRIEIWQCDMNGHYMHPRDRGSARFDPAFQGFGHDITDAQGGYIFRTIKPAIYPGRAPHIHVKVLDGERTLLTTQFYIKDHPLNARDFLFRRMSGAEAETVSMDFVQGPSGPEASIDVVI